MAIEIHTWEIRGISPLLQNNPAAMGGGGDGGLISKKKVYDPAEEAEVRTYRENGNFCHPAAGFRAGLLTAASGRKIGKRTARAVVAGAAFPVEDNLVLLDAKKLKPLKKYELHSTRVVVNRAGITRVRPLFKDWAVKLAMEIDTDFIPNLGLVTELLNIAGRICGLGDFRPDTSKSKSGVGTYGRYRAELER